MDNSSVDSEIIDTLDILRPRVRQFYENRPEKLINNQGKRFNVFRDDSNVVGQSAAINIERAAASSTSLILKKTSQREQILEKYSILSYTSLLQANKCPSSEISLNTRDKPLIKITVIPKSQQTQANKHRNRKSTTTKIQNTVSNHENSIHTKNLYLVVAGRKNEKVYEIKTTGSAKFSAEKGISQIHHEEESVKERSSIKQIIQSLNMDKKKKKGKMRKEKSKKLAVMENPESFDCRNDCRCMNSMRDGRSIDATKNRVRIFGQVGLTEDERYVMKCDAIVDGEPIITNLITDSTRPARYTADQIIEPAKYRNEYDAMACFDGYCQNDNYRSLRDSNIQVDLSPGNTENINPNIYRSVENQGTQVNFTVCPTNAMLPPFKRNEIVQCNMLSIPKNVNVIENETEHPAVKGTQSPLVIISVYPIQDGNETKATKATVMTNTRPISPRNPINIKQNVRPGRNERNNREIGRMKDRSPKCSRSPSPKSKNEIQKRKDIYQNDTNLLRTRTNSPNRLPTTSKIKAANNERIKTNPKLTDDSDIYSCKNMMKVNHILMSGGNKTNTEIKKALVDDYTRRLTETMYRYADKPDHETSKVKINIDSENEYYDVQFEQGQGTTDLQIRKTRKEASSQKYECKDCCASRENLYLLPEKEKIVSPSRNRKTNEARNIIIDNSNLNVRDSLEVNYNREPGPSKKDAQTHKTMKQNACCRDTDFLAPIKHFKGDTCELPDLVERDKQIRELLGINKGKATNSGIKQGALCGGVLAEHDLFGRFYKRDREKKLEIELSRHDLCTCQPFPVKFNKSHKFQTPDKSGSAVERTSLYQQLILNRNLQVFLQVEQSRKQKPIVLSRKQYHKVKRTIQTTVSRKISQEKRRKTYKCSLISVGEIRQRAKNELPIKQETDKQTQTDKMYFKIKEHSKTGEDLRNPREKKLRSDNAFIKNNTECFEHKPEIKTIVLFDSKEARNRKKEKAKEVLSPRQSSPSIEFHYATVGYMKRVTFSSTNIGTLSSSSILRRNESLFTIFKGRKRSVTPNLGTSEFSLPSVEMNSKTARGLTNPVDSKPKKPFLRRLMSCLVMRSGTSELKLPVQANPAPTTVNSSVDSYHFSTSLGAVQMGSSLYDTTASFYTSHSIIPMVPSKMKRGFFNSVREFLTSRKS